MPYLFRTKRRDGSWHPRWRFQYTDWRGRRRTGLGTTGKRETEDLALTVQTDQDAIRKGWKPAPKASDKPRRFEEVSLEYLAWGNSQGGRGGRPWGATHSRMRQAFLEWWKEHLNPETMADVVGVLPRVEKVLRELSGKGRSGKTLQNYADGLGAFFDWCVSRGYLETDPLSGLASFDTTPRTKRRAMTLEEIHHLLEHCAAHRRLCYEVAFASGLRAGELRSLRVSHLDMSRGGLQLEAAWTKNRRPGFQPLPGWLMEMLAIESMGKDPDAALLYVPTHTARDLDEDLERAGIAKWRPGGKLDFHACRVAYVTFILEAGASAKEAQALARHSTVGLTMNTYARTRDDRLVEVTEKLGQSLRLPSTKEAQRKTATVGTSGGRITCANQAAGSTPAASTTEPFAKTGVAEAAILSCAPVVFRDWPCNVRPTTSATSARRSSRVRP